MKIINIIVFVDICRYLDLFRAAPASFSNSASTLPTFLCCKTSSSTKFCLVLVLIQIFLFCPSLKTQSR